MNRWVATFVETRWGAAAIWSLLVVVGIGDALGVVVDPIADLLVLLAILIGVAWSLAGAAKLERIL